MLDRNDRWNSAWNVATKTGNSEIWQKLQEWVKEKTTEEFYSELVLAECDREQSIRYVAAECGNWELWEKL